MVNEDSQWGIHEKHWRALGDRLAKLSMDTEDWINLGWTAQDRRAKEFSRILMKTLPKSGLMLEHDAQVRLELVTETADAIETMSNELRESSEEVDNPVANVLDLVAQMVRSLLDTSSEVDTIDS